MAELNELIQKIDNPELRAQVQAAADKLFKQKKFGLVFEDHLPECTPLYDIPVHKGAKVSLKSGKVSETYAVLKIDGGKALCLPRDRSTAIEFPVDDLVTTAEFGDPIYPSLQTLDAVCNAPDSDLWHTLIEADNYHALQLLEYLYACKVDCIYIDPPYNSGAKDWKYNNDYVDGSDQYRHSKWLSMMEKRLKLAKRLLNPKDSVLIVTIDEKEYLHLGCLLEEMFQESNMQMITTVISRNGTARENEFSRVEEYVFICRFGDMGIKKTNDNMLSEGDSGVISRVWFNFMRTSTLRINKTPQYYPIYIDPTLKKITSIGDILEENQSIEGFPAPDGQVAVFPVRDDGVEASWGAVPGTARELLADGYLRVGSKDKKTGFWSIQYVREGDRKRIATGEVAIDGTAKDGSLILRPIDATQRIVFPKSVWNRKSHDATEHGTRLLKQLFVNTRFSYPKSLYAVRDVLRFFVADKPDALIVDFFAGSGTTLHAVNLLNAEDGGHRRCIMVTNNEVSDEETKAMTAKGLQPGDEEWEKLGIARYVTWPRTVCSIEGHDVNGDPLKGNYLGSDTPMADGFKANAVFFKLGFLDKTMVSLGRQFKEILPVLWMKAGAHGPCPVVEEGTPAMLILPENRMAILNDENCFEDFSKQLAERSEIDVVYLVTDYEAGFVAMTAELPGRTTYQLYRDYLENFRINAGRNAR